jgi:RimJ/RimL family protein N-acetyltransferase
MSWPPAPGTELTGATVRLAVFGPDTDTAALFGALDHEAAWTWVRGRPASREDMVRSLGARASQGRVTWVVSLRTDVGGLPAGSVVGSSDYLEASVTDARLEIGSTAYSPALWGTRVNPETKLLLLGHAFEVLGAGRVQLKTDVRNRRSQQAIARLGATYEGTLRRYQRRTDDTVRDTAMFSIIAEEWPAVRQRLRERLA